MLEIFALVLSVTGVIWMRKLDIAANLSSEKSREIITKNLLRQPAYYDIYLRRVIRMVDRYLQSSYLTFLALLFLSLVYSSAVFILFWTYEMNGSIANNLIPLPSIGGTERKVVLVSVLLAAMACYFLNKHGNSFLRIARNRVLSSEILNAKFVGILAAILVGAVVYKSTDSAMLSGVVFLFSALPALFQNNKMAKVSELLSHEAFRVGIASMLGPAALLTVSVAVVATNASEFSHATVAMFIFVFSAAVGLAAYVGCLKAGGRFSQAPVFAKPSISMGLHIANNSTGFTLGIAIATALPVWLAANGYGTIAVPVAILLTISVFAAGARTLAGSGLVVAIGMVSVSATLLISSSGEVFLFWAESLVFWAILPLLNSLFDWATWTTSRYFAKKILTESSEFSFILLMLDVVAAVLLLVGLAFAIAFVFGGFEFISHAVGGASAIDTSALIEIVHDNPRGAGLWALFMLISTLVPTIGHIFLVVIGGLNGLVPMTWRRKIRRDLVNRASSSAAHENWWVDSIAWRLAAIDHVTGVVVFFIFAVGATWVFRDYAHAVGELIYGAANWGLEMSKSVGSSF